MARYQQRDFIRRILDSYRTVAIVGLSTDPYKASHIVAGFLQSKGFRVIPVHPKAQRILGEKVYRKVSDVTEPVDIVNCTVNVFRLSYECTEYARQAVQIDAKVLWLQLNIFSE